MSRRPTSDYVLATVGCPAAEAAGPPSCEQGFGVVFRTPEGADPPMLLHVTVERIEGEPRIRAYYQGLIQLNEEMVMGGFSQVALVDPGSAGTQYEPLAVPTG